MRYNHNLLREDIRKYKFLNNKSYTDIANTVLCSYWTLASYMSGHDTSDKLAERLIKGLNFRKDKYEQT